MCVRVRVCVFVYVYVCVWCMCVALMCSGVCRGGTCVHQAHKLVPCLKWSRCGLPHWQLETAAAAAPWAALCAAPQPENPSAIRQVRARSGCQRLRYTHAHRHAHERIIRQPLHQAAGHTVDEHLREEQAEARPICWAAWQARRARLRAQHSARGCAASRRHIVRSHAGACPPRLNGLSHTNSPACAYICTPSTCGTPPRPAGRLLPTSSPADPSWCSCSSDCAWATTTLRGALRIERSGTGSACGEANRSGFSESAGPAKSCDSW